MGVFLSLMLSAILLGLEDYPKIFDVKAFGARGDGQAIDTKAIQQAIDACSKAGGGTVLLPEGHYLSGPIELRSKVTLQIEQGALLQATPRHQDFMKKAGDWLSASSSDFVPLIRGKDLYDITITGKGTIDGNGKYWWGPAEEARQKRPGYTLPRPNLIVLTRCRNVRISDLTIQNSPKFHIVPTECEDVVIEDLIIKAPENAPNTDGIDPSRSRRVRIACCVIDVGDDNVAIKSSRAVDGRQFACEDIAVVDCRFLHGHGMSIGSETNGGVRNVTVERCTFKGTENGIRIKTARDRGGMVVGLRCSDITMTDVDKAITITCYYPRIPEEDVNEPLTDSTPRIMDITIKNLTATCPNGAGLIIGLPESNVRDVLLEDVCITAKSGFIIRNATSVRLRNVQVKTSSGPAWIIKRADVDGL
ncbi:MAG: glycoside hydrolase family 28 protein [Sedimentisphaerales bacterium]|nr:glycoside hydrolase family 28 protein [Sedimentisphaerales bacterium]